jgi:hypothetical protein
MSVEQDSAPPPAFLQLWNVAARAINRSSPEERSSVLYLLPASLRHIADLVERSAEFDELLRTAFPHMTRSPWRAREALRRAGFYQAVRNGSDPAAVWRVLVARLNPHTTVVRTLALLDGCWFSVDRFQVANATIERLSDSALTELGPSPDVAAVFFPSEVLEPFWFSRVWFLTKDEERELKPTGIIFRFGYDVLHHFWEPILGLALYKTDHFRLPIILESDPQWRLERVRWDEPTTQTVETHDGETVEVPRTDYDVDKEELQRFTSFLAVFNGAIEAARMCKPFRLAARRYLRANEIAGPYAVGDDYEDALLQYVFSLEVLLAARDREAIGDKLATRAAWLVGTSDTVRRDVHKAVKKLYGERSSIVHGSGGGNKKAESRLLEEVRELMRRVLLAMMALRRAAGSDDECFRLLKTAAFDTASQGAILSATQGMWSLIDPGIPWPGPCWGPVYDSFPFVEKT